MKRVSHDNTSSTGFLLYVGLCSINGDIQKAMQFCINSVTYAPSTSACIARCGIVRHRRKTDSDFSKTS
jgi:hypothetical protein